MAEITIVTAFFSIGREEWKGFQKTDEEYFGYFSFWAKMKNKLVAYVSEEEQADRIRNIREGYGLKDRTECIVIPNIFAVDEELYESLTKTASYERIRFCRLYPDNPESWNPNYNYIMLMKEWCVKDAVQRGIAKGMIAWVDFGINKSGLVYPVEEEFHFLWEYSFPEKINLFALREVDDHPPIYEMIRDMSTVIQGGIIVAPADYWEKLWISVRKNMLFLNKLGLMDDDQTILLMAYLDEKELFQIHKCDWMMQFKEFGNKALTIRQPNHRKLSLIKRIYIRIYKLIKGNYPEVKHYLKNQRSSILFNKEKGYL